MAWLCCPCGGKTSACRVRNQWIRARTFPNKKQIILALKKTSPSLVAVAVFNTARLFAQNTPEQPPADLETLRRQVVALTKTVNALQHQLDEQKNISNSFNAPATTALAPIPSTPESTEPPPASASTTADIEQLRSDVDELKTSQRQVKSGVFNPDISAAVDFITSYSGKANNVNFTLRDAEVMLQSNVDQYARAYLVFNAETELAPTESLGIFDKASLGVEEAAIQTTALPWGLQLKAGQFFADFTRLDKVHSHDLPFVDRPRSLTDIIGGEDAARGFELNWLVPIPHYLRLTGGVVDNIGADLPITSTLQNPDGSLNDANAFRDKANRPFQGLMGYGRAATLVDLGCGKVLHLGADYAKGSEGIRRQIASADAKLEWQPDPAKYDMFETGGEFLWTKQSGQLSDNTLWQNPPDDRFFDQPTGSTSAAGGYVYAQYRFGKLWQPGVRVDYTHSNSFQLLDCDNDSDADGLGKITNNVWTYSAYLTLNLSEFNRLRLQLNYVNGSEDIVPGKGRNDIQAFFQWTVILGAHKHDFAP